MVRVYLSVDMEGMAGVSHAAPTRRGDDLYAQTVELMTGETNAAIEGAFAAGATDVTVNDSHGQMFNLPPEKLDPRARLVEGKKPLSMVEAVRESKFDVALFVGYHARAGHPTGVIAHTYNPRITLVRLNGRPATEAAVNALYLGAFGVPVGLVTGDDALAAEVADWLPAAERVVVKHALAFQSADSIHPARARDLIRQAAQRVVARVAGGERLPVFSMPAPIELRLEVATPGQAAMTAVIPGFERDGDREIVFNARDPIEMFRALISAARMVIAADD
jgi:D-amino peptidase